MSGFLPKDKVVVRLYPLMSYSDFFLSILSDRKAHYYVALRVVGSPIIEIQKTVAALDTTFKTVSDSVLRLCEMGILTQNSGEQRNRTFSYAAYLDILREGTV